MSSSNEDGGLSRLALLLVGDAFCTGVWVVASSLFGEAASALASYSGWAELELVLGLCILLSALSLFGPVCQLFGGALFNPVNNVALLASGKGSWWGHLLRMGAQLAGALAGSVAAKLYLPEFLQSKFHTLSGGIREGVAFEIGLACEGTFSFVLNYAFLVSLEADSRLLTLWMPMVSTAVLCWVGYYFTGPSLNPFVSFTWHLHYKRQDDLEHLLVFWTAPILGALLAGLAFYYRHRPAPVRRGRRPSKAAIAAREQRTLLHGAKEHQR